MPRSNARIIPPPGGETRYLTADDGVGLRCMIWPGTAVGAPGSVILLGGRSEFIEKHFETAGDMLARGFPVASMDWRGHGLSDRPLDNRQKNHYESFAPLVRDLDILVNFISKSGWPRPFLILAHSMGGHVALKYLHDHPGRVEGAVLSAPMVGLTYAPFGPGLSGMLARLALWLGQSRRYAPGQGDYGWLQKSKKTMDLLTSDPERFQDEHELISENPALALGGITCGWLAAAMASIKEINGPGYPEAINTPLLVVQAGADRLVDNDIQRAFAERLPKGIFKCIEGARHELLKERDELRNRFLQAFDGFVSGL